MRSGFIERRTEAALRLPEFEALRDAAVDIKNHTLAHLDVYLERYEAKVIESGGTVHWCADAADARDVILELCRRRRRQQRHQVEVDDRRGDRAQRASRGQRHRAGRDRPGRVHNPARRRAAEPHHRAGGAQTKDQIADLFAEHHAALGFDKRHDEPRALVDEARQVLRQKYLDADVGITGANFLIAETGSSVTVTNEGNAS